MLLYKNKELEFVHNYIMNSTSNLQYIGPNVKGLRSHSAQGMATNASPVKIPLPPRLWITDVSDDSSDETSVKEEGVVSAERSRVRSRYRHHKQRSGVNIPIGIFWDIENCQVPRGCSAIDVVAAIRAKFLTGRREAEFVVVCDVRKELPNRLQELNDAQVNLIHVCGTQKNAADEKLRQCMRRFGELHSAPAALVLISGDINFAADLSDFRHRKNMEVILVHKQNTSSALITCASSHYCYNELTANLPRNPKFTSQSEEDEEPSCEMEVANLPMDQPPERVSRRLRRLADNCGGKVLRVTAPTAVLRFPSLDHASRALKRMDGEDVFGRKISTRYARGAFPPVAQYSSDEGYSTAPAVHPPMQTPSRTAFSTPPHDLCMPPQQEIMLGTQIQTASNEWALALQQLPAPTPPPLDFCPPPAPKLRRIRGTHGSAMLDRSGCSSSNSGDDSRRENSHSRAVSPWNSSASFSEHSEGEESTAELTISNLPPYNANVLQDMINHLFSEYVPIVRVSVWVGSEGPLATVVLRSEWDARLAIAKIHKRRLEDRWSGRRLELSLGRPSPAPNLDVLRARLRAILLDQKNHTLPLLRLRDAYASRHCCALTTSDIMKVRDTVVIHEGFGRVVQLVDLTPVSDVEMEEAPWKCHIHASISTGHEDGSRILQPIFMNIATLTKQIHILLENHGGILPLLSLVECYEWQFAPLIADPVQGVALELLIRSVPGVEIRDAPSRHLTWRPDADTTNNDTPPALSRSANSDSSRCSGERERMRTAPALEPMLALFERELVDLLRTAPRCAIPFSKLIPSFHHHFGRQCRVADYGFTKLPDLLAALSNTVVVLGSGSSRVITLSAAAQSRRWTADLVKLLKGQPGRAIFVQEIPQLYQIAFGRPFTPVDYGLCTLEELMQNINPQAVIVSDGKISLPRRSLTPEERARTLQFAVQAVELLCYTPNLRMEFSRFVPAYHAHFGRQLRVAHYGCVKLVELFELLPDAVTVYSDAGGERCVKLSERTARAVLSQRLRLLSPIALNAFSCAYAAQFGALPTPDMLGANSIAELVYASGGCVEDGMVLAPGESVQWVCSALAACAVISADRSVAARGSTEDYFVGAFRRLRGMEPDLPSLIVAGVVLHCERHVRLTPAWRAVWRIALLLADSLKQLSTMEIFFEYTKRYEPTFPCKELGFENMEDFLRQYSSVFKEQAARWSLCVGVLVPRLQEMQPVNIDYSLHDTPPGQKGSRVFDSPLKNIWCSPPASALPTPTALLAQDKRRIRLAAQFDAV